MLLSNVLRNIKISETFTLKADVEFEFLEYCTANIHFNFLTFIESEKYIPFLEANKYAVGVICLPELEQYIPAHITGIVISNKPKELFYTIHNLQHIETNKTVVDEGTMISALASVAENDVIIGKNVIIHDFVVIKEGTIIEDDCEIYEHCTIGGKSFVSIEENKAKKFAIDFGKTLIKKGTKICSHCHIARGTLVTDITEIGEYCLLDSMIHVGHGTKIGNQTSIAAGVQIAGNTVIGNQVWIGVNATIANRLIIGNSVRISLGSVVTKNVDDGETVTGNFAIKHTKFIENLKQSR